MTDTFDMESRRDGFAIPMALMLVVFITVGVTTAFTRIQSETRSDQDRQARIDAFTYAQRGLEEFTTNRQGLGFTANPPAAAESTRIAMADGHADVILSLVKPKTATRQALYMIRSRGEKRTGNLSWMPSAQHTVTQFAFYREGSIQILSAWTSLSGLLKNGTAGTITGNDGCAVAPAVGGVAVPDSNYVQSGGGKASVVPTGNPAILDLGSPPGAYDAVKIDWDGIVNNNAIWPDLVYPTDPWPSSFPSNYWPVIRVNGNLDLPADGQGTLIVTGDMVINGSIKWDGILLVGGTLYANGNNNVQGAVISGLNVKPPFNATVAESDVGNGTKTYQYNSCNVANAVSKYATLVLTTGSWSDNYKTW